MSVLAKIKGSWIYTLVATVLSTVAITWSVLQNVVILPAREATSQNQERIRRLETVLARAKQQYDIPESVLEEFGTVKAMADADPREMLHEIENSTFTTIRAQISRGRTTRINYPYFPVTVSVANVAHDGLTTLNVGYVLPNHEAPQSLQTELNPAQSTIIQSSDETGAVQIFYIWLIASDPLHKYAVIEVSPSEALKIMCTQLKSQSVTVHQGR